MLPQVHLKFSQYLYKNLKIKIFPGIRSQKRDNTAEKDRQRNIQSLKVSEESCSNVRDAWEHTAGILELFR